MQPITGIHSLMTTVHPPLSLSSPSSPLPPTISCPSLATHLRPLSIPTPHNMWSTRPKPGLHSNSCISQRNPNQTKVIPCLVSSSWSSTTLIIGPWAGLDSSGRYSCLNEVQVRAVSTTVRLSMCRQFNSGIWTRVPEYVLRKIRLW